MKFCAFYNNNCVPFVAPFAGAWIEIGTTAPMRRYGIVAPFAGAWIEIYRRGRGRSDRRVAPFAGAWIEILTEVENVVRQTCRSLRGSVD